MRDNEFRLGHVLAQEGRRLVEILDARADIKTLAAAITLAQQRLAHRQFVERRDERAHGEAIDGRRRDDREFAHAGQRELHGARNRRRRKRQHVHLGAQILQAFLVRHAEVLLLVDHNEAEVLELDQLAENGVRADDDVDRAILEALPRRLEIGVGHHARHMRDIHRQSGETLAEIFRVLAREQRRRRDDGDLLAIERGGECGAQRHLGLAEADVAANEAIHGSPRGHVVERRVDGALLILRLLPRKSGAEFGVEMLGRNEPRRLAQLARGGDLDQLLRDLADAVLHPRATVLPARAAELVERRLRVLRAVAREQFEVFHRQEQLVAASVMQFETIVRRARGLDGAQADETPDAVIDMHNEIAGRQGRDLGQEVRRAALLAARGREPVAQYVLLADDGEIVGLEAVFKTHDGQTNDAAAMGERVRIGGDRQRVLQPVIGEHAAQTLARAIRPGGDDDALAVGAQRLHVLDRGLEHIDALASALGREIATGARAAIDDEIAAVGPRERREARHGCFGEPRRPVLGGQIQRAGRQGLVGRARVVAIIFLLARGVIILNLREPFGGHLVGLRVEHHGRGADVIEQRVGAAMKQRQPMLHAGMAAALADGFVELIAVYMPAELGDIGLAEAFHRLRGQRHLAHRHEIERAQLRQAALALGIEGTDGFQRVAEEIEAHGFRGARRKQIENAAAHGVFAGFAHGRRAQEAVCFKPRRQIVHGQRVARRRGKTFRLHPCARRHALRHAVDRHAENARPLQRRARARKPRQRRHAPRGDAGVGRHAIVGLAVPRGQLQRLDLGREKRERLHEGARALAIARHVHERDGTIKRALGQGAREVGDDKRVEPVRRAR